MKSQYPELRTPIFEITENYEVRETVFGEGMNEVESMHRFKIDNGLAYLTREKSEAKSKLLKDCARFNRDDMRSTALVYSHGINSTWLVRTHLHLHWTVMVPVTFKLPTRATESDKENRTKLLEEAIRLEVI